MAYPSVQAMKDALGDIILLQAYDKVNKKWLQFTFDDLPAAAQLVVFQWVNRVPT